ncbi:MAG: translation initiation factor IF-5A [Candidatus Micrarchaeota archaeon]|nr:translation initiation factor IF-5A [Candidatus Micrarchaeota archaeon]
MVLPVPPNRLARRRAGPLNNGFDLKNLKIAKIEVFFLSDRIFAQMGDLRIGKYVLIEDAPCRVVSMDKSKPGKHGAAKIRIDAIGLIDGNKRSLMKSSDGDVEVPIIERKRAQVVSVSGNVANLMDLTSYETFDAPILEDFDGQIEIGKEIQYMVVMGHKLLLRVYDSE